MKRQDQKSVESLELQMPECLEEHQDKSCANPPYRAPKVFLVGKAKSLMKGGEDGSVIDAHSWYTYP